jgi:putative ABC transport system permease protein
MAIMVAIPAGLNANQQSAVNSRDMLQNSIVNMQSQVANSTLLIEVAVGGFGGMGGGMGMRNQTSAVSNITQAEVSSISSLDGVAAIYGYMERREGMPDMSTFTPGTSGQRPTMNFDSVYTVMGIPFGETIEGITPTITDGRLPEAGESVGMVVTQALADYWGVSVGDSVTFKSTNFVVTGIASSSSTGFSSKTAYIQLAEAQSLYSMGGGVTALYVYATNDTMVDPLAAEIESIVSSAQVSTNTDRATQLANAQSQLLTSMATANATIASTQATATQETIIALGATSGIILLIMLYSVRERVREIGVMKTLGFSNRSVVSQLVLEGVVITIIGCLVGVVIGYLAYPTLSQLVMPTSTSSSTGPGQGFGGPAQAVSAAVVASPELGMVLLAFAAVVAMGALGSLYPAWKASRVKPVEALRND